MDDVKRSSRYLANEFVVMRAWRSVRLRADYRKAAQVEISEKVFIESYSNTALHRVEMSSGSSFRMNDPTLAIRCTAPYPVHMCASRLACALIVPSSSPLRSTDWASPYQRV